MRTRQPRVQGAHAALVCMQVGGRPPCKLCARTWHGGQHRIAPSVPALSPAARTQHALGRPSAAPAPAGAADRHARARAWGQRPARRRAGSSRRPSPNPTPKPAQAELGGTWVLYLLEDAEGAPVAVVLPHAGAPALTHP
jgi:hypothetical protein